MNSCSNAYFCSHTNENTKPKLKIYKFKCKKILMHHAINAHHKKESKHFASIY